MLHVVLLFALLVALAKAQTVLIPGDIGIICIKTDDPDRFSFVTLVDLEHGTEISFTDNGVLEDGSLRIGEGVLTYTAPCDITAGTVVKYEGVNLVPFNATEGVLLLSSSGDQLIAFQGPSTNPTFIAAVQTNSNQFQPGATFSANSALPPGLEVGISATALGVGSGALDETDNARYNGPTMATLDELKESIYDPGNWDKNNEVIAEYCSMIEDFEVLDDADPTPAPTVWNIWFCLPEDDIVGPVRNLVCSFWEWWNS